MLKKDLEKTYRQLNNLDRFTMSCPCSDLQGTLASMEEAGFVGMTTAFNGDVMEIQAFKAKDGPCFETGRTAFYLGKALAALDDDNHLVFEKIRVCEKTATVYQLEPYQPLMRITEPDKELINKDPIPFDCNTYERDFKQLIESLKAPIGNQEIPVYYPGPFKLLVLSDGAILRRGENTMVSKDQVLIGDEVKTGSSLPTVPAAYLLDLYKEQGSGCLLGELSLTPIKTVRKEADFSAFLFLQIKFLKSLLYVIENKEEYFILSGSDPGEEGGCCPSDDVGAAMKLVDAGVLTCYEKEARPDACPVRFFAFRDEIKARGDKAQFVLNHEFRAQVKKTLEQMR